MIEVIFMAFAIICLLGMAGESDKHDKRTYGYAFIACVAAVTILERGIF